MAKVKTAVERRKRWLKGAETLTLPVSGVEVLVRPVSEVDLIEHSQDQSFIQFLVGQFMAVAGAGDGAVSATTNGHVMAEMVNAYARAALVRPAVVATAAEVIDDEEQVYLPDIPMPDRVHIMAWAQGAEAARAALAFRDQAGGAGAAVEPVSDGADAGAAPVAADRPAEAA